MSSRIPISIYQFDDFRLYLKQTFEARRAEDPSCTHRAFASKAGFSNPGYFNDVLKERRKLSKDAVEKLIAVFSLSPAEADFFKLLVQYGQTKRDDEKQALYRAIVSRRNRSVFSRLNPALTRYYQDCRYPLIRNALMACDFRGNYEELARFIQPPLQSAAVKKIIGDLCEWGLVKKEINGRYTATEQFIEPASSLKEQLRQINREWITHGIDALMSLPVQKRHISSRLLSVSQDTAKQIAGRLEKLRDEIWQMVKNDPGKPSCVMQLNMQYFPRTGLTVSNSPRQESTGNAPLSPHKEQI